MTASSATYPHLSKPARVGSSGGPLRKAIQTTVIASLVCIGIGAARPALAVDPGVLNFRPPLGPFSSVTPAEFDLSLTTDLEVDVCRVINSATCLPLTTLDYTDFGARRVRLMDLSFILPSATRYTTTWPVPWMHRGRTLRITVRVNGLSTGSIDYSTRRSSLTISFMLYNDPEVRARQLTADGYGAFEIAGELVDEFALDAGSTTELLIGEGFDSLDLGYVLSDLFEHDASEAATTLADSGSDAFGVAIVLDDVFALTPADAAAILLDLYDFEDAIGGLVGGYDLDASGLGSVLYGSYSAAETYAQLVDLFGVDFESGGQALVDAGYSADEAVEVTWDDLVGFYIDKIESWGPLFRFHPNDPYRPSSIPWFLDRAELRDDLGNVAHVTVADLIPTSNLMLADGASETHLVVPDHPVVLGGDVASAVSYVHILRQEAFTDLQFWLFYPYNGHGTVHVEYELEGVPLYSPEHGTGAPESGEHYGDWEVVVLRLDNDTNQVDSVLMSGHGDFHTYTPCVGSCGPHEFSRSAGRVIAYPSLNGHANVAHAGENPNDLMTLDLTLPALDFRFCIPNDDSSCFDVPAELEWLPDVPSRVCVWDYIPIDPCISFATPSIPFGTLHVANQNLAADGGPSLDASANYEVVAAYNSFVDVGGMEVGADVFAETSGGEVMEDGHWMSWNGIYSPPDVEFDLLPSSVQAILEQQLEPVMRLACSGFDWGEFALFMLGFTAESLSQYVQDELYAACEGITTFWGEITDLLIPACKGLVDLLVEAISLLNRVDAQLDQGCSLTLGRVLTWLPQDWFNELGEALGVPLAGANIDSPGSRVCGFLLQNGSFVDDKPQWIYEEEPNEDCPAL